MKRRPTHPGEMLREDFLPDYGLTVAGLAEAWASRASRSTSCCAAGELSVRRWRCACHGSLATRRSSG